MSSRVILVEDEELISTMVRINLEKAGYTVTCFGDAEAMLEHVSEQPDCCDVLLLDIVMPGMHGDRALAELRRRGFSAPILMLTAKRDLETRVNTLDKGADDYLAKPFNVEELMARVRALIRRAPQSADSSEDE